MDNEDRENILYFIGTYLWFPYFYFMCMSSLPACMKVHPGSRRGESDPSEPELEVVVSHHMDAGN